MSPTWRVHLVLFIAALIQGFNFSLAKIVMPEFVSPGAIIVIRGICAAAVFWIISPMIPDVRIARSDYGRILLCSLSGIVINQLLFYKGLSLTQPINASLMVTIIPIMVLLISACTLGEKITLQKIVGITLGATGVILLILSGSDQGPNDIFLGDLMILINATSYAVFLVAVKPLMLKYHPVHMLKWMFTIGLFFVIPFGYEGILKIQWQTMPLDALFALFYVVIFATIVVYLLNTGVLKTANPSLAGIYIYIQPLLAIIIAVLLNQDQLTLYKVIFSSMILLGVFLVSKDHNKPPLSNIQKSLLN
jgi:drug/metabolite transporter (DMT)-like permease